jgi:hypothetical protein
MKKVWKGFLMKITELFFTMGSLVFNIKDYKEQFWIFIMFNILKLSCMVKFLQLKYWDNKNKNQ